MPQLVSAAASQDLIGWTKFQHGRVSVEFETIQQVHCALSPCQTTEVDWVKSFVLYLLQISHLQWIIQIMSMCNKTNTNLLDTNSLHSILRKIGHVIKNVVHQFVRKTTSGKKS
jgi:hypothetical protein